MRITTHIKSFIVAGLAIFALSGCSSGSSATGLGLGVSGFWAGTLFKNNAAFTSFTMSLVQILEDSDDAFSSSTLEGTFNSNDECIGGGTIAGTLSGNNVTISVTTANGSLDMAGTTGSSTMSGSWVNAGSTGEETTCNFGGTWSAGRS